MVLEKTLESPLDCKEVLKEISPGISLEGMMLKLKLQYFGHLMRRVDSWEKTLMLGGIWGYLLVGSLCIFVGFVMLVVYIRYQDQNDDEEDDE